MNSIRGMENGRVVTDYHVHVGQFYDTYHSPSVVIGALYSNGVHKAWISSTTSCLSWSSDNERQEIINLIEDEIKESVAIGKRLGIDIIPLYWVSVQRYIEGESIASIMDNSLYNGFKIHPKSGCWEKDNLISNKLFEEVCEYASANSMPILIHTGVDIMDAPERFEHFFAKYNKVKFVLAHCKEADRVIALFQKYNNVFGDTAFCPEDSLSKICASGFYSRMQIGTDFPITHWFNSEGNDENLDDRLIANYKNELIKKCKI